MLVIALAFGVHLASQGVILATQKAKGEKAISRREAKRLIKLWHKEIERLVLVSRDAYEESGHNALSVAHVEAIAQLTTARAVEGNFPFFRHITLIIKDAYSFFEKGTLHSYRTPWSSLFRIANSA